MGKSAATSHVAVKNISAVRNRDFRNWRDLKKRGGDFVIFSNCEKVKLTTPIVIDLGEVCREYKR